VHEFGHNVEQTIDLYNIDHFTLSGVPNTGFTEALAFVFQKRDLRLLGYDQHVDDNTTLDIFWGLYEIMGVSLVDMKMWQWLYANPDATAAQLKAATIEIARDVWNKYYAPVLGEKDATILACYSHMVDVPMYLPNYPLGHIIEFQLEEHFAKFSESSAFANEIKRIYQLGRLTPNHWMMQAVGAKPSTTPIINAVSRILDKKK
jgi:oligoendopeptidase F